MFIVLSNFKKKAIFDWFLPGKSSKEQHSECNKTEEENTDPYNSLTNTGSTSATTTTPATSTTAINSDLPASMLDNGDSENEGDGVSNRNHNTDFPVIFALGSSQDLMDKAEDLINTSSDTCTDVDENTIRFNDHHFRDDYNDSGTQTSKSFI